VVPEAPVRRQGGGRRRHGDREVATILPCLRDDGERLVPTCPDLLADLAKERERITKAIIDLQTSRSALDNVIAAAPAEVAERATSTAAANTTR
jgi:hypothetical protein